ncbi:Ral guanine nucleotide dissociation stimulator [Galemys pyrenaicus]|uniref:Ral guanine nucleotide dissociation stimulator n=1 Tax=Galemys pyrenaicus TaxID=202257 RepID=A0A8J6B3K9_GALPY|nr:Ral guanine nucleotide dissociation stimulator [Galemys pyrenaicus]
MDTESFKKVVPHQCLVCSWSWPSSDNKEEWAPTVCAHLNQFKSVVTCVISTCLGNRRMTAQDRATVLEHWLKVALECQFLMNFSSFHAILSALQSPQVQDKKKSWKKVSSPLWKQQTLGTGTGLKSALEAPAPTAPALDQDQFPSVLVMAEPFRH